jgi:two-component system, chemotaxis family, CheB/CheR fusion protein
MGAGLELTARRKDGSEIAVEISLSALAANSATPSEGADPDTMPDGLLFTAFIRDVRERRALWAELRAREVQLAEERAALSAAARLAAVVESSDDAIISKTLAGTVTGWNSGAEALYGYTPEEIVGQPIQRIAPPDRSDEVADILARLRGGERVTHFETVRRRKDGALVEVSITVSPIRDSAREWSPVAQWSHVTSAPNGELWRYSGAAPLSSRESLRYRLRWPPP